MKRCRYRGNVENLVCETLIRLKTFWIELKWNASIYKEVIQSE